MLNQPHPCANAICNCGITVNVVSPGALMDDGPVGVPAAASLGDRVPVGRSGSPEDVLRAVFFFASPAADFLTEDLAGFLQSVVAALPAPAAR